MDAIKELGPWVLSTIALIQVWVIAAWQKYGAKGSVEIHESGNIEISFGQLAPSIALTGTLAVCRTFRNKNIQEKSC